ncbi:MAG: hypothetical protein ACK5MP_02220 [Nostocoides sp.]
MEVSTVQHRLSPQSQPRRPLERTFNRRAVVAAAWASPGIVISTGTPALASSPAACVPQTLTADFSTTAYVRTSASSATYTWTDPYGTGVDLTLTIAASLIAGGGNIDSESLTTLAFVGTTGNTGVALSYSGRQNVAYSYSFNLPVTSVSYVLTDIDKSEAVWVTPTPASGTIANSTYLTGSGTQADPWTRSSGSVEIDNNTSNQGNVSVAYGSGLMSSFQVVVGGGTPPNTRTVYLTSLTFTTVCP